MKKLMTLAASALAAFGTWAATSEPGSSVVTFDANGGILDDTIRVVSTGKKYGENQNLYPSDSVDNFSDLPESKITLSDGLFSYQTSDRWCNYWSNPIDNIVPGAPYTYVIDVLTYENESSTGPWFNVGWTGDEQPSQLTGAYRQIGGAGRITFDLTGHAEADFTTLGRDFVDFNHADAESVCRMTFRVGLYAGKNAVPTGADPVAAGEFVEMSLPTPTRVGYAFAGWADEDGNVVTDETVVTANKGENHTLTAQWTEVTEPGKSLVTFDPNGGVLDYNTREVVTDQTFGQVKNLYTADLSEKGGGITDIANGVFTYETAGQWCNYWTKPLDAGIIVPGKQYTYVLDILTYEQVEGSDMPEFHIGWTDGDTWQSAQLGSGNNIKIAGVGRYTQVLTGRAADIYRVLERAYIYDPAHCRMTFRVQLFAGACEVAADTAAKPGETVVVPLPVPTRAGFEFAGWKDSEGNTVTADTVVTAAANHDQTLTAAWVPGLGCPIRVVFNSNGGVVSEKSRWVKTGDAIATTMNLYPSDKLSNFNDLNKGTLANNIITLNANAGDWCNIWTKNVNCVEAGESYTYVVEVLSVDEGDLGRLDIGRTGGYDSSWQNIQIVGTGVDLGNQPGAHFVPVLGAESEAGLTAFNFLCRDYLHPAVDTRATLRISLFSGSPVNAENFSYVAPGESMALALPVPTCRGKIFDRWVDEEGNTVTDETVVPAVETVALTAVWKPWNVFLSNVERPAVGTTLTISTNYGDGAREGEDGTVSYRWYRGDWSGAYAATTIGEGGTYTLTADDLEHFVKGVVVVDGVELLESSIWFSKLPVVYIDTADGQDIVIKTDEKDATVRVQGNSEFKQQYSGAAKVKGRGNSTWGMPKKPYKVKLDKKTDMFGFGKNKHWVLLANYIDVSSMRNKLAYDMSGEFGLTYQDSTWVEVVFNGRFDGTYQFGEHIRVGDTRVNVFDWESESEDRGHTAEDLSWIDEDESIDVSGGYLWEFSNEYDDVSRFSINTDGSTSDEKGDIPLMFNRPEFAYTSTRMMNWCKNYWTEIYKSWTTRRNVATDGTSWTDLCDIDSMVSYWLINEIFGNDDAWYKSRYCHKDLGGKLTFGPVWDFDWGCGSVVVGMDAVTQWRLAKNNNSQYAPSFYKQWLNDPGFCLRAYEKYWEMRPKFTALFAEGGTYDQYAAYLAEAGLVEDARWDAQRSASYGANKRTQAQDVAMFKEWMTTRLAWLDGVFATVDGFIAEVQNGASANKYEKRGDKLTIEMVEQLDAETNMYSLNSTSNATLKIAIKCSARKVDVMINGKFVYQGTVTKYGNNDGIVDVIAIPAADWYVKDRKTLIELVTRDADSGAEKYSNHIVIDPIAGLMSWADVTEETTNAEIVPAAQAEQLDALNVKATKVAAWATAKEVAFDPTQAIDLEAFALNTTTAGVADEKTAFKLTITIDADGTPHLALPEGKTYNIDPVIEGRKELKDAAGWHAPWVKGEDHFFRGVIDIPTDAK